MSDAMRHSAPRVLFACGGTGGHVYPAIAIADAVRAEVPDAAVAFAGTEDRMEWEAVPKAGYPIHAVTVSGFPRALSPKLLAFPFTLGKGFWESWTLVGGFDPDVVVGTGGYVSGPVGLAASLRRRPLAIQEQNAYAGATNKLLARFADQIFIAFEAARAYFPPGKSVLSGNPVRADLTDVDAAAARAHFGIEGEQRVLLAMGGSLGAGPINDALRRNLDALLADERLVVVWQTGRRYFDDLRRQVPEHPRLRLLQYLDRMDYAYAVADLAVCRAGAITCSELAVTGTPSILVPSPNVTADHQTKNAKALADEGAANHVRLCADHGEPGVNLLVWGREAWEQWDIAYPARQTREASEAIVRRHGAGRPVLARQARAAIGAGAFHNDVVCVGTKQALLFHEGAFEDKAGTLDAIRRLADGLFEPVFLEVSEADLPFADAVKSYLFNSQLLALPGQDRLTLLAPTETEETPAAHAVAQALAGSNGPIGAIEYVDVRQSMRNGGGPACLRLRVVLTEAELVAANPAQRLTVDLHAQLSMWAARWYRDALTPRDLADPALLDEVRGALDDLTGILNLGSDFYPFQRA